MIELDTPTSSDVAQTQSASLVSPDCTGLLAQTTPLTNRLALALSDILDIAEDGETTLEEIRKIARDALAFDRDSMRLRFDDHHGNRSYVEFVDRRWKVFRADGVETTFQYCFGYGADECAIEQDLYAARTIHSVQSAALAHVNGHRVVQVEAVSADPLWKGARYNHVSSHPYTETVAILLEDSCSDVFDEICDPSFEAIFGVRSSEFDDLCLYPVRATMSGSAEEWTMEVRAVSTRDTVDTSHRVLVSGSLQLGYMTLKKVVAA
ncbi:hypothetical protein [Sphingomonas sp. 3-13AW]|uniref:hypothetical protein n=1 Tax=Sphingomonas sp. 3-13AW TaxID=3050450 RepID=UPI003BB7EB88